MPDVTWLHGTDIASRRGDTFVVDEAFSTTRPGVFAAGDAVTGPATIVEAVAHGNLVAVAVDHWLKTGQLVKPYLEPDRTDVPANGTTWPPMPTITGPATPRRPVDEREAQFPRSGNRLRRTSRPRRGPPLPPLRPGMARRDETPQTGRTRRAVEVNTDH